MASNLDEIIIIETEMEAIKKDLLRKCMKGEWEGIINIYNRHPEAHAAKLTINEDTALHIVVSGGREETLTSGRAETVEQLMNVISSHQEEGQYQISEFKNKGGNTPLHVAASMGSLTLCRSIVETGQLGLSFMEARNCKGETPLFLAALSGNKEAFIFLHNVCQENNLKYYDLSCRSNDDETILHVAIATKCFDLALEIIRLYPKLVHLVNKQGFSPLHALATDPSPLESAIGTRVVAPRAKCFPRFKSKIRENQEQQEKAAAYKVMNQLVQRIAAPYEPANGGSTSGEGSMVRETLILIATKNGIIDMIENILETFPEAVYEVDSNMKNIVLLSVEHKQCHVYTLLLQKKAMNIIPGSIFWEVDNQGNTALHLAAKVGSSNHWPVPGAALQMNWEIKWFEYVKATMPERFRFMRNNAGETPEEVFTKSHKDLLQEGGKWLTNICKIACPVATGVFVASAFSTSPNLDLTKPHTKWMKEAFRRYLLTSLVASGLSIIAVSSFILVMTSCHSEKSFRTGCSTLCLLLLGLAACYISGIATFTSFLHGHLTLNFEEPDQITEISTKYGFLYGMVFHIAYVVALNMLAYYLRLLAFTRSFRRIRSTKYISIFYYFFSYFDSICMYDLFLNVRNRG